MFGVHSVLFWCFCASSLMAFNSLARSCVGESMIVVTGLLYLWPFSLSCSFWLSCTGFSRRVRMFVSLSLIFSIVWPVVVHVIIPPLLSFPISVSIAEDVFFILVIL